MFTHTTATLEGLSTIRAFKAENRLIQEYDQHQNLNSSAWFLFVATSRKNVLENIQVLFMKLFAFKVVLLSTLTSSLHSTSHRSFTAFWFLEQVCWTCFQVIVTSTQFYWQTETVGSNVGLAITQAINLIGMCNWGLRQTAELENQMTSVERVIEYTKLPSERSLETKSEVLKSLPENWASRGVINFKNVSVKYSDDGDFVLRNLSFTVNEKVCGNLTFEALWTIKAFNQAF